MAVDDNTGDDEEILQNDVDVQDEEESQDKVVRAHYNPMISYVEMAAGIFAVFTSLALFGYGGFLIASLVIVIFIYRETYFVTKNYPSGFVKKGSVFNAFHSTAWLAVLAINVSSLMQYRVALILPEIVNLTELAALFILMAFFGTRNITRMYIPLTQAAERQERYPL